MLLAGLLLTVVSKPAAACLWDSDTLIEERFTNPKMASAIFDEPPKPDVRRLRERIATLEAARREDDPAWWNDLAGAHIRLGESQKAVEILEPVLKRFPKDYGIHANLGTAYHLLGRYQDAEREIARDLEINPEAHFGLERYHLALLQYLVRDKGYQTRHLYVDEWTLPFLIGHIPMIGPTSPSPTAGSKGVHQHKKDDVREDFEGGWNDYGDQSNRERLTLALEGLDDLLPLYRRKWDLGTAPKLAKGVTYMATLNRKEPACWAMLGVVCIRGQDYNLGIAAYEKAIMLGSPQASVLNSQIGAIRRFIGQSAGVSPSPLRITMFFALLAATLIAVWRAKRIMAYRRAARSLQRA